MNSILAEYDKQQDLYNDFRLYCETLLKEIVRLEAISVHMVDSRLKSRASLSQKIERPNKTYNALRDLTDIAGLRIITYFADDVDRVGAIIEREFAVERTTDKRKSLKTSEFGYLSMHYITQLDTTRRDLVECRKFSDLVCEIQVRSVLQHAWAEIEHDLGYKTSSDIPENIRRKFSHLASVLEGVDNGFRDIRDEINRYAESARSHIAGQQASLEVDEITVRALVEQDRLVRETDAEISKAVNRELIDAKSMYIFLARALRSVGLTEVGIVQSKIHRDHALIVKLANLILDVRETKNLGRGISLSYLYLVTLAEQSQDSSDVSKNFNLNSVGTSDPRISPEKLAETVRTLKKQFQSEMGT